MRTPSASRIKDENLAEPPPPEISRQFRVDTTASALGLATPPDPLQLWWLAHAPLRLYGWTRPGKAQQAAQWLVDDGLDAEAEDVLAPRSFYARGAPRGWPEVLLHPALRRADLHPAGTVSLLLEVPPHQDVPPQLLASVPQARLRPVLDPQHDLTHRQREVLAVAVQMGYYEVPRHTSIRDVAQGLGLSPAGTSELLRRGERVLVAAHFDRSGMHGLAPPLYVPREDDRRRLLATERVRRPPV